MANGDLDGDIYIAIWDDDIVQNTNCIEEIRNILLEKEELVSNLTVPSNEIDAISYFLENNRLGLFS